MHADIGAEREAPFRHIDALRPGQEIMLRMPYARFVYVVQFHRIVLPTACGGYRQRSDRVSLSRRVDRSLAENPRQHMIRV